MIIGYKRLFSESKSLGLLYHFTSERFLDKIFKSGYIMSTETEKDVWGPGVSTTRNSSLWRESESIRYFGGTSFLTYRFVLDGNKLSNNYKIIPVSVPGKLTIKDPNFSKMWSQRQDEMEERVLTSKIYLNKYLLRLDIIVPNLIKTGEIENKWKKIKLSFFNRVDSPEKLKNYLENKYRYPVKLIYK